MDEGSSASRSTGVDFVAVAESVRFRRLKRSRRSFVLPLAVFFLVWYFSYVLLAAYAPEFMSGRIWGEFTFGLLWGLGQFATTFVITMIYVVFANRRLDSAAALIREELESQKDDS